MPIQVSTRSRYGLRLMISLAMSYRKGISLMKDVSRREGISEKYLGQIIIPLKAAGFVASQRGARGGYMLARPPEEITVADVVAAIEGRISPAPCVEDPGACGRLTACVAAQVWRKLSDDMVSSLASFTLADLARMANEGRRPELNYAI